MPTAFAAKHDDAGARAVARPVAIAPNDTGSTPLCVDEKLRHPSRGDETNAELESLRPMREVDGGLGAFIAARPQVLRCTHGRRPSCARDAMAFDPGHQCQPSRSWAAATRSPIAWMGSCGSGYSGRSGRQGHRRPRRPQTAVGLVVPGRKLVVVERQSSRDAVRAIERESPREGAQLSAPPVEDRAAADAIEHHRLHLGRPVVDRVILGQPANGGVRVPGAEGGDLQSS